jgi:hypothetical protein
MRYRKVIEFDKRQLWYVIEAVEAQISVEQDNLNLGNHDVTAEEMKQNLKLLARLQKHWRTLDE